MHNDWPGLAEGMTSALRELRAGAPDVMSGFSAIARAALGGKALDPKTKELIALRTACDGRQRRCRLELRRHAWCRALKHS
jgi:alkylhydroperoxidase/carboxymuconolactone decarboxylase family protein YurZ